MAEILSELNTTGRLCANIELRFVVHTLRGGALRPVPQWRDGTLPLGYFFWFFCNDAEVLTDGESLVPVVV